MPIATAIVAKTFRLSSLTVSNMEKVYGAFTNHLPIESSNSNIMSIQDERVREMKHVLTKLHLNSSTDQGYVVLIFFQVDGFMSNPRFFRDFLKSFIELPLQVCCVDGTPKQPQLWQRTAEQLVNNLHEDALQETLEASPLLRRMFEAGLMKAVSVCPLWYSIGSANNHQHVQSQATAKASRGSPPQQN